MIGKAMFSRRFVIKQPKQLTVMQFVASDNPDNAYAFLEISRGKKVIKKLKVSNPKVDNSEIVLEITTEPPPESPTTENSKQKQKPSNKKVLTPAPTKSAKSPATKDNN